MAKEDFVRYVISLSDIQKEDYPVVGEGVYLDYYLKEIGVQIPSGFVITKEAYDDFLLDNEAIPEFSKLLEKKDLALSHLTELADDLKKSIKNDAFNQEIIDQIRAAVTNEFGKSSDLVLTLCPSFVFEDEPSKVWNPTTITINLNNFDDLLAGIKEVYASFYSSELISERLRDNFNLSCFAVVVKLAPDYLLSGIATLKNIKDETIVEINGGYGVDMAGSYPDSYTVSLSTGKIRERSITDQEEMKVRKGAKLDSIKTSSDISSKQKLPDHKIHELVETLKKINEIYKKEINVYWGYEKSKLFISHIEYQQNDANKLDLDDKKYSDEINQSIRAIEYIVQADKKRVDRVEDVALEKSINKLIKKRSTLLGRLHGGFDITSPLLNSSAQVFFEQKQYNYTDTNILRNANGNGFIDGSSILEKFNLKDRKVKDQIQKEIMKVVVEESAELALRFQPKELIYQISDYASDKEDSNYIRNILTEASALKLVKEAYDYSNIGICIPDTSTLQSFSLPLLALAELKIENEENFKIYYELKTASLLMDLEGFFDQKLHINIEGFVVAFDQLISSMFGKSSFYDDDKELFLKIFKDTINKLKDRNYKFIFRISNTSPDLLKEILELNPYGIILPYSRTERV